MELMYQSTRSEGTKVTASQAILKGLADDGGLFVPVSIPKLDVSLEDISKMTYQETAYEVMKLFFTDFTENELKTCIERAYDSKFDTKEIAPLVKKSDAYYLELFHGATIAFKDMALSILPHLLTTSAKKNNIKNEIVILTATSGDTGKAALAGFADVEGTSIIVFYPKNGVSKIQERQMVTQKGANTKVVGITGNFDDAQSGVKAMFNNKELAKVMDEHGYQFSSANSINIGRLVPQVVYYVYSYTRLLANGDIKAGEKVNFVVPTGNFGNILAAFYAKNMGVPVGKLICRIAGDDAKKTAEMMDALKTTGKYTITDEMKSKLADFTGGWASEEDTAKEIKRVFDETGYVMDTHTAVASSVYHTYKEKTNDDTKTIIASTASPYKFGTSVMSAIDKKYEGMDDFALIDELCKTSGVKIPNAVEEIRTAPVLHDTVCETKDMQKTVEKILGL